MQSLKRIRTSMKQSHAVTTDCLDEDRQAETQRPRKRLKIVPEGLRRSLTLASQTRQQTSTPARSREDGPDTFRFLDLPGEIRMLVYDHIFVKRANKHDPEGVINICGVDFWERPPLGEFHMWTHPLLRTNRQIRDEGLNVFFKRNTFVFENEFNMNLFLNVIGDFGRERIRSVAIGRLPRLWFGEQGYGQHDWTRIENYLRMLARLPNLWSLRVSRSPYYFQERSIDDDDASIWYPDIHTMDVTDALRTAYLGWIPLHLRGLKHFSINWGHLELDFNPIQRRWFAEVERRIRAIVALPKPPHYFKCRTRFIYKGYEAEERIRYMQYARFYLERLTPRPLLFALHKPSDFFSTFAFDPDRYERQQKWRNRRRVVTDFLDDRWWDVRHPKYVWRRLKLKRSTVVVWREDDEDSVNAAIQSFNPVVVIPPPPPPSSFPPPPDVVVSIPPSPVVPALVSQTNLQQLVVQADALDGAGLVLVGNTVRQDLVATEPMVTGVANVDDGNEQTMVESPAGTRASSSLGSLLQELSID